MKKMKKILALILCMAFLSVLAVVPVSAATNLTAPKATVTIDGVRDDTYGGPYDINAAWGDDPDCATGKAWTAWDDNYLYFYIEVEDTTPNHEHSNDYEVDCVEIFLDWYNAKESDTSDETKPFWQYRTMSAPDPSQGDRQFSNGINHAAGGAEGTGWTVEEHRASQEANTTVKPLKGSDLKGGYIIETGIEYKKFGINVSEGAVIGLDLFIGDNKEGTNRNGGNYLDPDFISGEQWQYPEVLGGLLTLGAAPAPAAAETPAAQPDAAPAPAADVAPAPEPAVPAPSTAPKTADPITLIALTAIISSAGVVIAKKRK